MMRQTVRRRQRGVVLVLVALLLIPLIAFVALVVDLGMVMFARTQCQNAADAAAMAGARTLNGIVTDGFNYANAGPNAVAAATTNRVLAKPITTEQVTIAIGRYTYDATAQKFEAQVPGPASEPWTMVQATITHAGNYAFAPVMGFSAFNVSTRATAVHRPRDVCIVSDFSGSMRFDSLLGIPYSGNRQQSNNPETVFPEFGQYADVSGAGLRNPNAFTEIGGNVYGSANVTTTTPAGDALIQDFYQNAYGDPAAPAFTPAPDSYATTPAGDIPLKENGNTGANFARTAARIIYNNNTTRVRHDGWETDGYELYVNDWYGYTIGPRYWGKTFFIWPPDPRPANDWRGKFFKHPSSGAPIDDNTRLWDTSGYWKAPSGATYRIDYNAILQWLKTTGPNPFPNLLQAGGILYYDAIPDSFTTINVNLTLPTFPNPPTTDVQKNERFWKDYIDHVLGVEQNSSGGNYSLISERTGYRNRHNWSTSNDPIRITAKPTAGVTYGNPPASMDYRDNPRRPRLQYWFGPMTLVDFLGNYNEGRYWWPGTCHEAPLWQCKLGIQAALQDIKNNHPNDFVSLVFFSHPKGSAGSSSGRFNRVRAPLGQDYDRLIKSLWYPLFAIDNPGQLIRPYESDPNRDIKEVPNAQGGTCYPMGLMLAYNQFSAASVLRNYNTTAGAPVGDAGGLGRRGAAKLVIFETDGNVNTTAYASFSNNGAHASYYNVRQPNEFPSGINTNDVATSSAQTFDIVDRITALETDVGLGPGYSTTRKPVLIHCLIFGTIAEPAANDPDRDDALDRLQMMQYKGGKAGGEQTSPTTPLADYKIIIGTQDERIAKLREAFSRIMQDGVQVSLIE